DGDRRLRQPRAHGPQAHRLTVSLGWDRTEQRRVCGVDEGVLANLDLLQMRIGERAARAEGGRSAEANRGEQDEEDERNPEQDEQPPLARWATAGSAPARARRRRRAALVPPGARASAWGRSG